MNFDQFMGDVQHRARMATTGEAVRSTYATLRTMGERLYGDEAEDLAAQLPPEIGIFISGRRGNRKPSPWISSLSARPSTKRSICRSPCITREPLSPRCKKPSPPAR
mgnify:CR=1 FL=1